MTESISRSDDEAKAIMKDSRRRAGTLFRLLDADGDGVLSAEEITSAPEVLRSLITDGDGCLREEDFGGPTHVPGQIRRSGLVRVLDADGDLIIGPDDIADASARILTLDRDGDGMVTAHDDLPPPGANFEMAIPMGSPAQVLAFQEKLFGREPNLSGPLQPKGSPDVQPGYLLVHEVNDRGDVQKSSRTFLMDEHGRNVHEWPANNRLSEATVSQLLDDGTLLRTSSAHSWIVMDGQFPIGANGTLSLHNRDGDALWEWSKFQFGVEALHHDFEIMPNGNVLLICYDIVPMELAQSWGWVQQGDLANIALDKIIEIKPNFENNECEVVWEWSARDHLTQNTDGAYPNFGLPDQHPERIDLNWPQFNQLQFNSGQLFHMNAISYNADDDIILVSVATFGEIWIIDHSTTTSEATGRTGGKHAKGGDILWRWGNPQTQGLGGKADQILFWQHDAHFIPANLPHSGDLLVHNNGMRRGADGKPEPDQICMGLITGAYSDILELKLPRTSDGELDFTGEPELTWSYNGDGSRNLYSPFMSGAQRMTNGNTLIVQGCDKRILEVSQNGQLVLDFHVGGPGRMHRICKYPPDHPGIKALGL